MNSNSYLSAGCLLPVMKLLEAMYSFSAVDYSLLYCYRTPTANAAVILHRKQQHIDTLRIMH